MISRLQRTAPGDGRLVGIGRTNDREAWNRTQAGELLHRLMGRSVLPQSNAAVGQNINHMKRRPVRFKTVLLMGRTIVYVGANQNQRRTLRFAASRTQRTVDRREVGPIRDRLDIPAVRLEAARGSTAHTPSVRRPWAFPDARYPPFARRPRRESAEY
jgi:hypothetical protein